MLQRLIKSINYSYSPTGRVGLFSFNETDKAKRDGNATEENEGTSGEVPQQRKRRESRSKAAKTSLRPLVPNKL